MSAGLASESGQGFGVNGFVEESEAGGAELAVALGVNFSHQHVVLAWKDQERNIYVCMYESEYVKKKIGFICTGGILEKQLRLNNPMFL